MKALKILTAAVFATFAVAAQAAPFGAGGPGCPAGATPGAADCPARGAGHYAVLALGLAATIGVTVLVTRTARRALAEAGA